MDLTFKERLERRKQELLSQHLPQQSCESTPAEQFEARLHSFIEDLKSTCYKLVLGAAIFSILLSAAVFRDWWGFLGSPEYSQYKQRIEKLK